MTYWILKDGEPFGPFCADKIVERAKPDMLVSNGQQWVRFDEHPVFGKFASCQSAMEVVSPPEDKTEMTGEDAAEALPVTGSSELPAQPMPREQADFRAGAGRKIGQGNSSWARADENDVDENIAVSRRLDSKTNWKRKVVSKFSELRPTGTVLFAGVAGIIVAILIGMRVLGGFSQAGSSLSADVEPGLSAAQTSTQHPVPDRSNPSGKSLRAVTESVISSAEVEQKLDDVPFTQGEVRLSPNGTALPPDSRLVETRPIPLPDGFPLRGEYAVSFYETDTHWRKVLGFFRETMENDGWAITEKGLLGPDNPTAVNEKGATINFAKESLLTMCVLIVVEGNDVPTRFSLIDTSERSELKPESQRVASDDLPWHLNPETIKEKSEQGTEFFKMHLNKGFFELGIIERIDWKWGQLDHEPDHNIFIIRTSDSVSDPEGQEHMTRIQWQAYGGANYFFNKHFEDRSLTVSIVVVDKNGQVFGYCEFANHEPTASEQRLWCEGGVVSTMDYKWGYAKWPELNQRTLTASSRSLRER